MMKNFFLFRGSKGEGEEWEEEREGSILEGMGTVWGKGEAGGMDGEILAGKDGGERI